VPLLDKAARARELGYRAVEFWWPFATEAPAPEEEQAFIDSVRRAEVETVLVNFPGGGPSVDDRGLLCVPGREDDFLRCAQTAISIGRRLGATRFNPMVGNGRHPWSPGSEEFDTALANLVRVAPLVEDAGGMIVLEPLSGFPDAAVKSFAQARELVIASRTAGALNVAILLDLYHAAVNGDEVLSCLDLEPDLIGHVQIADSPGRGWPGSGELPLATWLRTLHVSGYSGRVGLECKGDPVAAGELRAALTY
jgi:hydroxypyruvate isomerase